MTARQDLYGLLSEINQRPELQRLGVVSPQSRQNLWDAARTSQPVEQPVERPTTEQITSNILPSAKGLFGGSDDIGHEFGRAIGQSTEQGALDSFFTGGDIGAGLLGGTNPALIGGNILANAINRNYGFDESKAANRVGSALGTFVGGPMGGMLGGVLGGAALDYGKDYFNKRDFEPVRDFMEDAVTGRGNTFGLPGRAVMSDLRRGNLLGGWQDVQPRNDFNVPPDVVRTMNDLLQDSPQYKNRNTPLWSRNSLWDNPDTPHDETQMTFSEAVDKAYGADKFEARMDALLADDLATYGFDTFGMSPETIAATVAANNDSGGSEFGNADSFDSYSPSVNYGIGEYGPENFAGDSGGSSNSSGSTSSNDDGSDW